ncbi:MAG: sulfurtransferase TusA family protein [Candidatus Methanoperedens sp.]|nr:sulfurtransferase TusA family protein [Candidatus Methanoperedens sp.]
MEIMPDSVLDVRGEICPIPLFMTKKQIDHMSSGEILKVIADNSDAPHNIELWTKKSGDKILEIKKEGQTVIIYLKKN